MDFHVDPDAVNDYAQVLEGLNSAIDAITEYMHTYALDKSGFTGLFMVLQPVVDLVGSLYGETLSFGRQRLASLMSGVQQTASAYQGIDEQASKVLQDLLRELQAENVPVVN
ncbi:hypothetical protein LWP59_30375 [Amycolatopsis acidiphila]|uniref:Uncharacterized protein n=1 Tax=Amycolatopsis acidiphila TaxID=715473 RepID=A0A558A9A6_9PSEU|nr:hypothetical protein [Amycolatopsis acidiphila]TVT20844.1 hypothetical protein FNH06_19345 [Amycolatopsis acidiphila]UIJ58390.1 hypothetical protein LWP59_30375 [Amycolatopsis acidiphila]GHG93564.1 hypothetical protein GCM10017788_71020 [Amycolatopsis acidiphila]